MTLRGTRVEYVFFIAQKLFFANQYVRKFHKISKIKNFKVQNFSKKILNYTKISSNLIFFSKNSKFSKNLKTFK